MTIKVVSHRHTTFQRFVIFLGILSIIVFTTAITFIVVDSFLPEINLGNWVTPLGRLLILTVVLFLIMSHLKKAYTEIGDILFDGEKLILDKDYFFNKMIGNINIHYKGYRDRLSEFIKICATISD